MKYTIQEFTDRASVQIPYIQANNARFLTDTVLLASMVADLARLHELNVILSNPATRTTIFVHERQELIARLGHDITAAVKGIEYSTTVTLTQEDRDSLFIETRKEPSSSPIPTFTPKIDVVGRETGLLELQFSNPATPEINYRKLPEDVNFINVFIAFIAEGDPIPEAAAYHLFKTVTKSTDKLLFESEERAKEAYIKAAFGNSNGVGPLSEAIHTVIPN